MFFSLSAGFIWIGWCIWTKKQTMLEFQDTFLYCWPTNERVEEVLRWNRGGSCPCPSLQLVLMRDLIQGFHRTDVQEPVTYPWKNLHVVQSILRLQGWFASVVGYKTAACQGRTDTSVSWVGIRALTAVCLDYPWMLRGPYWWQMTNDEPL